MEIRNIAIIAHVNHGKTTLTDALMYQTGAIQEGISMDSNALEQERGITIYSKNAALFYKDTKINIVDTPGHADFGSEVERVLHAIDSVLLLVDAQEGPMPQTRFVLKKSLEFGLKPIVVINKIDKKAANSKRCEDQVLELFFELGATDKQIEFPVVYTVGRLGIAKKNLDDDSSDLTPLLDTIIDYVPCTSSEGLSQKPLVLQPFNLGYDNFLGRLAIGRVYEGVISPGKNVFIKKPNGEMRSGKITKVFTFKGLERIQTTEAGSGDIVLIAGLPTIYIGETITTDEKMQPLPAILVDEPTIALTFLVNNSPFAGQNGKYVTSRRIREYLKRELEVNVGLRVDFNSSDSFQVFGRGELHIEILLENMRRSSYELQVSQPQVIIRQENGNKLEPFEEVIIDTSNKCQGMVIERLSVRGFILKGVVGSEKLVRLTFEGPTRGLLGYRNQFIIDTKGQGILSSRVLGFRPYVGEIRKRSVGSMISMADGKALGYALWCLQKRGVLYIGPGTRVYNGMVIGNTSKGKEMAVNPTKGKQLTNMRSSSSDEAVDLVPPFTLTIERALQVMSEDEYLEVTPNSIRLRKKYLTKKDRPAI